MKDKLALLVSYFLPKMVKQYATLDWLDSLPCGELTIDCPKYKAVITKTRS